jgi:hypothetical protein
LRPRILMIGRGHWRADPTRHPHWREGRYYPSRHQSRRHVKLQAHHRCLCRALGLQCYRRLYGCSG